MAAPSNTDPDFNAFVGAETGLLKGISANPKASLAKNFHTMSKLDRQQEITCMSWGSDGSELITGLRNRTVKVFDPSRKSFVQGLDCSVTAEGEENHGSLRGVARVGGEVVVTAAESGLVKLWRYKEKDRVSFNTIDVEVEQSPKLRKNDSFASEEDRLKHLATLKADRLLCKMRHFPDGGSVIATGGKENDLQVWDLDRPAAPTFRAKNVPPNYLQLRVPVWVSDLCFPDASSRALVATANRHGQVRLYDTRANGQRRPVQEVAFEDQTLTAMSATPSKDQVLVGTATGELALFDFRQASKGMFRKYKGCVGSVRSVDCDRTTGYFAAVGLDRFLRLYHVESKKTVQKMYLKSRLNCVLLARGFDPTKTEEERAKEASEEEEEVQFLPNEEDDEEEEEESEEEEEVQIIPDEDENEDEDGADGTSAKRRKLTS